MFYLRYLWAEFARRWGKTLTISLGLGIASAIIITIISVSQSLSSAQSTVLNPLQNVGTDIMVTRSVDAENLQTVDEATRTDALNENRITTDLSKLGNPGDQFSNDTFMPGTMLTFDTDEATKLDTTLVSNYATGLVMNVVHQEGKIPQVTAEFKTGGERIEVNQAIEPLTAAEQAAIEAARDKAMAELKVKNIDPRSSEGRAYVQKATNAAMPERLRKFTSTIVTPERTFRQDVGPIATDIATGNFTVAGVDTAKTDIGLILPDQITSGSYFSAADQIVVNQSYADKKSIKLSDKVKIGDKEWTVVGMVQPKLYSTTADVYLPLSDLQKLAGRENRINVMLIKSTDAKSVEEASKQIESAFPGAKVTNAQDTAEEVSGSLVSAANLTNKFIGITSIVVIVAAFIIVSLLTVISVNKRIREIGTLKAIGWKNSIIIRQIIAENMLLGIIGGLLGAGLAVLAILGLNQLDISLSATIANSNDGFGVARRFLGGSSESADVTTSVPLKISVQYLILLLGVGVAFIGSIVAGALASLKASKMKPQEAFRNIE